MKACSNTAWITLNCWKCCLNKKEKKIANPAPWWAAQEGRDIVPTSTAHPLVLPLWEPLGATGPATPFPSVTGISCFHLVITAALQLDLLPGIFFFNGVYFPCFCRTTFSGEQPLVDRGVTSPGCSHCRGVRLFSATTSFTHLPSHLPTHPQLSPAVAARLPSTTIFSPIYYYFKLYTYSSVGLYL